jgi:anti-sigma-K factor RskA
MTINTHDLPATHDGQFYYAWLLDPTTNKMLPLGQVGPSGTASFEVSDHLLAAYSAVDVSLEDDDGDPQHSPTSVLRATYA